MSEKKPRNPDVDFGFHATIPRVIRTGYKNLTSVQKWLYVCLKDLCGETGTCYRTLRTLAEETGISTGMLSESITALHKEGLIHAEKKKRSSGGKEVWHITIVDIWQANAKAYPTKRSHSEQTSKNVHTVNGNTNERSPDEQTTDDCSLCEQERSPDELECSHSETEEVSSEEVSSEEEVREREVAHATSPALSRSSNFFQNDEERQKYNIFMRETRKEVAAANKGTRHSKTIKVTIPKRPTQKPITMPISAEAQRILDDWQSIFKRKIVIHQGDIDAAERFVQANPTKEELGLERAWLFSTDDPQKPWYRKIGVSLAECEKKWGMWQSVQEAPPQKSASNGHLPKLASNGVDYSAAIFDTSQNFITGTEEEREELERRLAEKKAREAVKR